MADCMNRLVVLLTSLLAVLPVLAETLSDPTRPPPGLSADTPDAEAVTGPVLQSVMIPKQGKPIALIGGQQVGLGQRYGERRLIRLTEWEAVLAGPAGIERLWLTPGIEKTKVTAPVAKGAPSGNKP
ncbi:MAG: hypothetical protein CAPSK01_003161 [Candidatus Accumulibacter vicinus]|uniref:MSHA biogenesis protein MshK n=2 Tax=Candidatus Accumulibacter vicinus TaxID=2954382 RepID=A0A084XY58_9PROT|nr:MAG: hypothetical protein CAPSK01_003161 [Candidatus Accumulibacter vicinus]